jgi:hypothetical protein
MEITTYDFGILGNIGQFEFVVKIFLTMAQY